MSRSLTHYRRHRMSALAFGALLALCIPILVGCGDDPVGNDQFQAAGVALRMSGADVAVDSGGTANGSIEVAEDQEVGPIDLVFISKTELKRGNPTAGDYTIEWAVADPSLATVIPTDKFQVKVKGVKAGTTTVRFSLHLGAGTVYTSKPIPVTVTGTARGLAVGDSATYNFYDRDTTDQRVNSSQKKKVWTPLSVGIEAYGKTGVTKMLETTWDMSGTLVARDTLYFVYDADGSVYQYDLLRKLLVRTSSGSSFSDKLEPMWVKVSNTKMTAIATWKSFGQDSAQVKNITVDGIPLAVDLTYRMNASHRGTRSVSVPAGTYSDAVHTDHTLGLIVKPSSLPLTALNDSLIVRFAAQGKDGIINEVFQSKKLVAQVLTATQDMWVTGFELELVAIKRQ